MQTDERGLGFAESVQLVIGVLAMGVVVGGIIQIAIDRHRERKEAQDESIRRKP